MSDAEPSDATDSEAESGGVTVPDADADVDLDAVSESADMVDVPLKVRDLRKTFGGITAVDGAGFEIEKGSMTGLIGPNGAGKSTTFNCITGTYTPDSGVVEFNGEDITGLQPHEVAERGLVRTFQIARELSEMTVLENMMVAPMHQRGESLWKSVFS